MERFTHSCRSLLCALGRFHLSLGRERVDRGGIVRILAILPPGPNRLLIEALSREAGWALTISDMPSASFGDNPDTPPIVLYDRELSLYDWRETIRALTRSSPRRYVILLSSTCDTNLWDELERLGGSDILRTPTDRESVLRAVRRAWSLWHTQQQVRLAATPPAT